MKSVRWLLIPALTACTLPCLAQDMVAPASPDKSWSAKPVPAELVEAVINGNLFVPDQRREPRVEPAPGEAGSESLEVNDVPFEVPHEDPDRQYRLIGSSYTSGEWLAFIENLQTREIHRVAVDQAIASGKVSAIEYNRIEYAVNDQTRSIVIGRDLTGAESKASMESSLNSLYSSDGSSDAPPPLSNASGTTPEIPPAATDPFDADARREEILRRLRERRERENQ